MNATQIERLVQEQRARFRRGETLDAGFRREALLRLADAVRAHEGELARALLEDLGKSREEAYLTEIGLSLQEIGYQASHLGRWSRPRRVRTPLALQPASSRVVPVPYGSVLVMAPWNYPVLLTLEPLAGALAAGNCVVVKPSAYAPQTSAALARLLRECFDPGLVAVVEGGRQENEALLDQRWDYIFFTGSPTVGRLVMERAARWLTPVSLELGGKSPCIVDATADLGAAARRIAFGKWLNAGQTCVAPDYLLVDRRVKDDLLGALADETRAMYGRDPLDSPAYGRIVNRKHFERVRGLLDGTLAAGGARLVLGGRSDEAALRIEPTIIDGVSPDDPVMREEIFGPLLPVLAFDGLAEAEELVRSRETPLALYLFTRDRREARRIVREVPFGGGCVNDTVLHLATPHMGFGGMGASGMGSYHGRESFETFSHRKSVLRRGPLPEPSVRYQPYSPWKARLMRMFLH